MKAIAHGKPQRLAQATKRQAEGLSRQVAAKWRHIEMSWWDLGRLVERCLARRVPAALGMNAHDWMEKYIPGSTQRIWRALRIRRALQAIPEKKARQLTEGNAYNLSRLPEKMRKQKEWVDRATRASTDDFQEQVTAALEKKGVPREEFVTFRLSLPRPVFEQVEAAVQKMARICEIDIETMPGRRIMVWERIAMLVNGISEEALKAATEGGG